MGNINLTLISLCILFGIGFGFFAQRAGLCIVTGITEIFMGKGKRFLALISVIVIICAIGFSILGLKPAGELRCFGIYNLLAGIIFGIGIFISGGCITGSMIKVGEGNISSIIVLLSMIPGMALSVYVITPLIKNSFFSKKLLLTDIIKINRFYICAAIIILAVSILITVLRNRNNNKPDKAISRK